MLHCTYAILTRWNSTGHAGNFCILHRCPAHTQRCPVQPTAPNLRQPTFNQGPGTIHSSRPINPYRKYAYDHIYTLLYSTLLYATGYGDYGESTLYSTLYYYQTAPPLPTTPHTPNLQTTTPSILPFFPQFNFTSFEFLKSSLPPPILREYMIPVHRFPSGAIILF